MDHPGLGGAKFIRLVLQLPLYDGALRRRIEFEQAEEGPGESRTYNVEPSQEPEFQKGQQMSMKEALARTQGDETAVLHALNEQHSGSQFGPLFEYETG
jgi:hypothetical protein